MQYSKVTQVAHYVPDQIVTNDDLSKIMDTSDEWISSRTGIRERRISRDQQTSDLATEVGKQLLEKANLSAEDLDFIIIATISGDSTMPSTAAKVQANLGASKAFAYDISAACSGFVFALATADKFIQSGSYSRGLVIGAEVISKVLDWSDRTTAVLFGDGAGGVLVEASEEQRLLAESLRTDGTRSKALTSGGLGLSSPYSIKEDASPYMDMDGRAVFDFAVRTVTAEVKDLLSKSTVSPDDVDYYFLHQANSRILDKMAKKLGQSIDKFPANMMKYGNTSAASIPILLSESVEQGIIQLDGQKQVILCGFGGGLTWGTLLVKI